MNNYRKGDIYKMKYSALKKEENPAIWDYMDEPGGQYLK